MAPMLFNLPLSWSLFAGLCFFSSVPLVCLGALHEKEQVYFGVWPNTDARFADKPLLINQKLGFNVSAFQMAQLLPLPKYNYTTGAGGPAPEYLIEQTQTDAALLLSVFPDGFNISDQEFKNLATQLASYTKPPLNRTVFLRFAPEMQGQWFTYGFQPSSYIPLWRRMYQAVKADSPETAVVWAPNTPQNYPYSQSTEHTTPEDFKLLDTDGDGKITQSDDPFTPYYPGDDFVDWIGISSYYKGPGWNANVLQRRGYCAQVLNGTLSPQFSWYEMFCNRPGKACMVAESGSAYHLNLSNVNLASDGQSLDLHRAWWQDCITSPEFWSQFPRLKLTMHFEHQKVENDGGTPDLRDYRITNDTATLEAFKSDIRPILSMFVVPAFKELNPAIPESGKPSSPTPGAVPKGMVFQTHRNPPVLGPPTLFGKKRSDAVKLQDAGLSLMLGFFGIGLVINLVPFHLSP